MHVLTVDEEKYDCEPYFLSEGCVVAPIKYAERVVLSPRVYGNYVDPFGPWERVFNNAQTGAQRLFENGLPVVFRSGSLTPSWAMTLLSEAGRRGMLQKVLNGEDDNARMTEVEILASWGINVAVFLAGNYGPKELLKRIADSGAVFVIGSKIKQHAIERSGNLFCERKSLHSLQNS